MFQIKKYLHYKNTPDGKPEVLEEARDFSHKSYNKLWLMIGNQKTVIANLEDCRPLLAVKIEGEEWTEGDICIYKQELFADIGGSFFPAKFVEKHGFVVFNGYQMNFELYGKMFHLSNAKYKIGSFFDDPAKYSKLLWGCSEEEGWEKVLKLLGV